MDFTLANALLSSTYVCNGTNFLRSASNCANVNKSSRFKTFQTNAAIFNISNTLNLNLAKGYNFFTNGTNLPVNTGDMIIVTFITGRVAVDKLGASVPEYVYSSSSNLFVSLNSSSLWRLYIRATVSPVNKMISTFKKYSTHGTYSVTTTLSNIQLPTNTYTVNQSVIVQEVITGLSFVTSSGTTTCFLTTPCQLIASSQGSNINYVWTVQSNQTVLNQTQINLNIWNYQFPNIGVFSVNIFAYNNVSSQNVTVAITIIDKMYGLYFKSETLNNSSSIVDQNANFLFVLIAGQNYNCSIDFGDGSKTTINDLVSSQNNSIVPHKYNSEKMYVVSVNCTNPVNSLNTLFNHYVQYPLTGLQLVKSGTTTGISYNVGFFLQSGSLPYQVNFMFDNTLDTNIQYSSNLVWQSSNHNPEYVPTLHYIYINMSNYVSYIELNTTFEISTQISSPAFNITPITGISSYLYQYPMALTFWVSMPSGSNINIFINTDSSNQPSSLTNNVINIQTIGLWSSNINDIPNNRYVIPYTYSNPGHYTVFASISNSLGSFNFTQSLVIMSQVNYLIPNVVNNNNNNNNYVIYDNSAQSALARFAFTYAGNTKAGSDSTVTFWPGDQVNSTFGPYTLSMDFNANISKSSLQYTYSLTGNYLATFFVINPLGSKVFTLNISVVVGMSGFYMSVNPLYGTVGSPVLVSAYMVQGTNIQYTWLNSGSSFSLGPRTCIFYFFIIYCKGSFFGPESTLKN